jgi:hypothetical protein
MHTPPKRFLINLLTTQGSEAFFLSIRMPRIPIYRSARRLSLPHLAAIPLFEPLFDQTPAVLIFTAPSRPLAALSLVAPSGPPGRPVSEGTITTLDHLNHRKGCIFEIVHLRKLEWSTSVARLNSIAHDITVINPNDGFRYSALFSAAQDRGSPN